MRLRRRNIKLEEKSKKLLKLKPPPVAEAHKIFNDSEPAADKARRGRKPKRLTAQKEHENSKLSGDIDLLCPEKPMMLGLIVKDEQLRAEIVQVNSEQVKRLK